MPVTAREWIVFTLGASLVVVLAVLIVANELDSSGHNPTTGENLAVSTSPTRSLTAEPHAAVTTTASPSTRTETLVLSAARGDSWIQVRKDSNRGPILFEGILSMGRTVRLRGRLFWVRFGAAAHVDVSLSGKPLSLQAGTFDTLIKAPGT